MKYVVQVNGEVVVTKMRYKVVTLLRDIEAQQHPAVLASWRDVGGVEREVSLVGDAVAISQLLATADVPEVDGGEGAA